jgi:hypothetical protein
MKSSHERMLALRVVSAFAIAVATAEPAIGQGIPKSQLGVVTQQVGTARVELTYRRPVARGRQLFGSLVPFGKVWTPSADTAVHIVFSTAVQINGQELAAGSYSMWAIPDSSSWTMIFNSTARVFHLRYPEGRDVLRVQAAPRQGDFVETLQFAFPMVDADSAVLELRWGTTVVPMSIKALAREGPAASGHGLSFQKMTQTAQR